MVLLRSARHHRCLCGVGGSAVTVAAHRFNNDLRYRSEQHPNQTQLTPRYVLGDQGGRPAMNEMPQRRRREHGAMVTANRLVYALDKWGDKFEPHERDEISHVIWVLESIAVGSR